MGVVIMQGVPKIFGALRGHLCDSIAFLFISYHRDPIIPLGSRDPGIRNPVQSRIPGLRKRVRDWNPYFQHHYNSKRIQFSFSRLTSTIAMVPNEKSLTTSHITKKLTLSGCCLCTINIIRKLLLIALQTSYKIICYYQ